MLENHQLHSNTPQFVKISVVRQAQHCSRGRPGRNRVDDLVHVRPLETLVRLLILPHEDREDLDGRIQPKALSPVPALRPVDADTRLQSWSRQQQQRRQGVIG